MFIGHFAAGLAAKTAATRPSLGTYFMATQFADLLWPILLMLGVEVAEVDPGNTVVTPLDFAHYPISHSLLLLVIWGGLFGLVYWMIRKDVRGAVTLGLVVVSHWVLDVVMHRPDLPLIPGGAEFGLGLWNSLPATLAIEFGLFGAGVWLYARMTRAKNRTGTYALWVLVAFLAIVYLMNVFAPPPEDIMLVAWAGLSLCLLVAWGYRVGRKRRPGSGGSRQSVRAATT